ncbi:MAG: hypothetical protein U0232_10270 [Thermomicrobiales bacterium]
MMPWTSAASTWPICQAFREHHLGRDPRDRQRHEYRRRAVPAARRPAIDQAAHEGAQPAHVERVMLELDDQIVVGSLRGGHPRLVAEDRDALAEGRLILFQQFDEPVDAHHLSSPTL